MKRSKYSKTLKLFCHRRDVYAKGFVKEDGSIGFGPVRRENKKNEFQKITDDVLRDHFRGHILVGVYSLQEDNTTKFLVVDFDDHHSSGSKRIDPFSDSKAYLNAAKDLYLPAYIERSKSGNGYHVWIFFENPVQASKARQLGELILSRSGITRNDSSFCRFFPSQDKLTGKKLGNLIALPYWGKASKKGNSIFLNPETGYKPYGKRKDFHKSVKLINEDIVDMTIAINELYNVSSRNVDFMNHLPTANGDWVIEALKGVSQGKRNSTAASLTGHYCSKGLPARETKEILTDWNIRNNPPLELLELHRVVDSIYSIEQNKLKDQEQFFDGNKFIQKRSDLFPTAREAAKDLVRQITDSQDIAQVFSNVSLFAELDVATLSQMKTELKSIFGNKLNLNDFTKAVNESKLQIAPSDDHPAIGVTNRPPRDIMEDCLNIVYKTNSPPTIFVRGGELVRYRSDENGLPIIEQLNEAILTGILTERANFFSGEKTLKHTPPPFGIIKTILAAGTWDFPALEALIETPLIRKDGTIVSEPGYDPITGSLLHLDKNLQSFNVPQNPSKRDIKRAIKLILEEILVDFPFVDDRSKANAVALLLTPFIIPILDSPTPMAVIDAPSQGSGKGLLAIITSIVATGREVPMMNETTEEERRKRITTELYKGCTAIMIDNVTGEIKSDALATVLTSSYWSDRLLGGNRSVRLRNGVTWMMSGNNVKLGGDLPRRCYWIKLDAKVARPHLRKGFKHKNLIGWVTKRRQKIMTALLTIVRAWFVSGKPKASVPSFGSYREWSNIVGGILQFVGIEGFLENMDTFMDRVDEESSQWHAFLRMLKKRFKKRAFTSSDIARLVRENNELLADFPDLLGAAFKDPHASFERKLGKSISQKVDVRYGKRNLRLEWVDKRGHVNRWRVVMDPQKD